MAILEEELLSNEESFEVNTTPEVSQKLKDHKVAVIFYDDSYYGSWGRRSASAFCNCGYTVKTRIYTGCNSERITCPTCGSMLARKISKPAKETNTVVDGIFECISKDDKSFHIKKTEVVANIKVIGEKKFSAYFKEGKVYELKYSLKDKTISVIRNGKDIGNSEKSVDEFFRGNFLEVDIDVFLEIASTEKNYSMFKEAIDRLGKRGYERNTKIGRALKRMFDYPAVELLMSCGFKDMRYLFRNDEYGKSKATKPHEVLKVSKMAFNMLKEMDSISSYTHNNLSKLSEKINGNTMKEIVQIMKEEARLSDFVDNADLIIELYEKYGYKDLKRLMLYTGREVKLEQGIMRTSDALQLLKDYARMSIDMRLSFNKFSKSLKKDHDVTQMNYNVKKDQIKARKFSEKVNTDEYKCLEYSPKYKKEELLKYIVVTPKESVDLINEGSSLSHCVASYIDDVISGKCKILFMRNSDKMEEPLITIEVRDSNIRQARGKCNRSLDVSEKEFVEKWAKEKELQISLH
jgi:hypothetical protein